MPEQQGRHDTVLYLKQSRGKMCVLQEPSSSIALNHRTNSAHPPPCCKRSIKKTLRQIFAMLLANHITYSEIIHLPYVL